MRQMNSIEKNNRDEIVSCFDLNMFLEAGAGAGKTTLIVERIVNQLKSGKYEPKHIVAITFTNKAAEELRLRITKALKEAVTNAKGEELAILKNALNHLDEMNISTIHSFCNVLLKEQSIAAGLPSDISMLEESDNEQLKRQYFNEFARTMSDDTWKTILQYKSEKDKKKNLLENIYSAYKRMCDLPETANIINAKIDNPVRNIEEEFRVLFEEDSDVAFGKDEKGNTVNLPSVKKKLKELATNFSSDGETIDSFEKVKGCLENNDASDKLKKLLNAVDTLSVGECVDKLIATCGAACIFNKSNGNEQKVSQDDNWKKYCSKIFERYKNLNFDSFETLLEAYNNSIKYPLLVEQAIQAKKYFDANHPQDKLSNDRLLQLTRKLLCSGSELSEKALGYFAKKYKCFYVDEFQDTDNIQADFILKLAEDVTNNSAQLRDGALFVVGDPKQSIYRFRGAEPEVYFEVKDKFKALANAKVYELNCNFRSNNEIIEWVNDRFAAADSATPIMKNNPYTKMDVIKDIYANSANPDKLIHGVYRYNDKLGDIVIKAVTDIDGKSEEKYFYTIGIKEKRDEKKARISDATEKDIDAVIRLIKTLVSEKDKNSNLNSYKITDYEKDPNTNQYREIERDIRYDDFLLICLKTSRMNKYITELQRYGIPVRIDGKISIKDDLRLKTFINVYKYLINPNDNFYKVGVIETLRESGVFEALDGKTHTEEEFKEFCEHLLFTLKKQTKRLTAFGKASYLEKKISLLFAKNSDVNGLFVKEEQTRIKQMLEVVSSKCAGDGFEIISEMENYLNTLVEHELPIRENDNAVRFMNLHKSKGLEGNIVIILDRDCPKELNDSEYKERNNHYPSIFVPNDYGSDTLKWAAVTAMPDYATKRQSLEEAHSEEFHRLEYVAVTRAAQAVVFMDVINHDALFATAKIDDVDDTKLAANSYNYNINSCKSINEIIDGKSYEEHKVKAKENRKLEEEILDTTDKEKQKELKKSIYTKVSPSGKEIDIEAKKEEMAKKAREEKKARNVEVEGQNHKALPRPVGDIVGTILHRTMEILVNKYKDMADSGEIEKLASISVKQAMIENELEIDKDDINSLKNLGVLSLAGESKSEKLMEIYENFIKACAISYYPVIREYMKDVEHIYTETSFSYFNKENSDNDRKEWVNGTADLILKYKDGRIVLIDYKSDNDFNLTDEQMNSLFNDKYSPQIDLYKEIIEKQFGEKPTEAVLISFSQKDEEGNLFEDNTIRIRKTVL